MDSTIADAERRLQNLPACFNPLKQVASRYLEHGFAFQENCLRIGRHRKYGHDHYYIALFSPADPDWLVRKRSFVPPIEHLKLLSYTNGLSIFSISFYGFTPTMQQEPPLLDRRRLQCLDVTTANELWRIEFKNTPPDSVYIGGRAFSFKENSAYFMTESGEITAFLKNGSVVGRWPSVWQLMAEEIEADEKSSVKDQ